VGWNGGRKEIPFSQLGSSVLTNSLGRFGDSEFANI
jgi:hypothetical protein